MGMPPDIGIVDTMIGFPHGDMKELYRFITRQTKDAESKEQMAFPAEYMFKQVPDASSRDRTTPSASRCVRWTAGGSSGDSSAATASVKRHSPSTPTGSFPPRRPIPTTAWRGSPASSRNTRPTACARVGVFPAGTFPQVPINDKKMYPVYAKCIELDIPVFVCAGVPGPRLKASCQHVELIDEVMFDFPDLVFVTRHGCEPWTELAVKLMLKWPGLHYSTSAFAPKYYPKDIIDYANTRAARAQDHVRRLLSHGTVHRADHDRNARPRVHRQGVAEIPATNALRVLGLDA